MKRFIISLLLLSSLLLTADDQNDTLWQKAQDIVRANWNWVPGVMEVKSYASDEEGNEMPATSMMFSFELEEGEIIGYYDGGMRGEEMILESDPGVQQILKQDVTPDTSSIFTNDGSWELQVTRTGVEKKIKKVNCAEFSYSCLQPDEKGNKQPTSGSIWLDTETGAPLYNEENIDAAEEMVKELTSKVTYEYKKGEWQVKNIETLVTVEAMGHTVHMRNVVNMKKHWRMTE